MEANFRTAGRGKKGEGSWESVRIKTVRNGEGAKYVNTSALGVDCPSNISSTYALDTPT